jgi:hypothetical protein
MNLAIVVTPIWLTDLLRQGPRRIEKDMSIGDTEGFASTEPQKN